MHIIPRIAIASGVVALFVAVQVASAQCGSNGAWGPVPMPPQSALSDAEIKTLAA